MFKSYIMTRRSIFLCPQLNLNVCTSETFFILEISVFEAEVFLIYQGEKLLTIIAHDVTFLFSVINKYIHIYIYIYMQLSLNLSKYHILFLFMVRNSSSGNINNSWVFRCSSILCTVTSQKSKGLITRR